jgi:hypothetical protein
MANPGFERVAGKAALAEFGAGILSTRPYDL